MSHLIRQSPQPLLDLCSEWLVRWEQIDEKNSQDYKTCHVIMIFLCIASTLIFDKLISPVTLCIHILALYVKFDMYIKMVCFYIPHLSAFNSNLCSC